MANTNLKALLREYEQKRMIAEDNLENYKKSLYSQNPRLEEIDNELTSLALKTNIAIMLSKSKTSLDKFKKDSEQLKNEREDILKSMNIDPSSLCLKYSCNLCKDTGYIQKGSNTIMCNCLKQRIFDLEYNKSNIVNIQNYTFKNFSLNLYSEEINEAKYNSQISPRDNIKIIKKIAQNFINNFDNDKSRNLLFTGNTGLGKTYLSSCIANEILKQGKTVLYQTAPVMLDEIINTRFNKPNSSKDLLNNILNVDLLIIDDLGAESINSLKLTELFNIINTRILGQNGKLTKTIISTNLTINDISKNYDGRITSRLIGEYDICRFYGDDIRFVKRFSSKK